MVKKVIYGCLVMLLLITSLPKESKGAEIAQLRIGITQDESTLNPYTYITGSPGLDLVSLMYDNLFQLDAENTPQPWLVKEYKISEDGLKYEFTLHDNVKFHDGEPLTTEDIAFTIQYFLDNPKSRFTNPLKIIKNVDVQSNTQMTLTLQEPDPNFMIQPLADLPILPQHIWSTIKNPDESDNNIGSGPYIMESYTAGEFYKMVANENYFKGNPTINKIIFPIIEDTTALFTALQSGELDAVSANVSPELVEQFSNSLNVKLSRGAGFSTSLLQINAERYPMSETEFRQAMSLAIDKKELIDTVLLGYAEIGSPGFIHPSSSYFNNDLNSEYDPEKAKRVLKDAGFVDQNGDGFVEGQKGEEINLEMLVYSSSPTRIREAEIITEWLNDIGIKTSVRAMDMTTVDSLVWPEFDVSKGRDYDISMWGWSSTMQLFPDRIVELFHTDPAIGSVNLGAFSNENFDQLSKKLNATINSGERKQIIMEMQALVAEQVPIIPLSYQEIINAYNPQVYDDYTFQLGKGVINKLSFVDYDGEKNTEQIKDTDTKEKDSENKNSVETASPVQNPDNNNGTLWILVIVIIVVVGGIVFIKKRGSKNE